MVESAKSNQHAPMRSEARRLIPQQRLASARVGDTDARANHATSGNTRLLIAPLIHLGNSGYRRRTRVGACYFGLGNQGGTQASIGQGRGAIRWSSIQFSAGSPMISRSISAPPTP